VRAGLVFFDGAQDMLRYDVRSILRQAQDAAQETSRARVASRPLRGCLVGRGVAGLRRCICGRGGSGTFEVALVHGTCSWWRWECARTGPEWMVGQA
jgi:hypothetical protein